MRYGFDTLLSSRYDVNHEANHFEPREHFPPPVFTFTLCH